MHSHSQASFQSRPRYPQSSFDSDAPHSAPPSGFPSTSSLASVSPATKQAVAFTAPHLSSAPLPSPSNYQPTSSYFAPMSSSSLSAAQAQAQQQQQQQQQQAQAQAQAQAAAQRNPQSDGSNQTFVGQRGDGSGVPVTAPFLQDFNLVAEAAKRAQMACLARDLGDVGL